MPIYEYQCQECHKELEALRKISDGPLVECPACGKPALKKKVSAAAFRLKGGGWYETDFKTGSKKNLAAGTEGSSDSSGEKKASTDTKAPGSGASDKKSSGGTTAA